VGLRFRSGVKADCYRCYDSFCGAGFDYYCSACYEYIAKFHPQYRANRLAAFSGFDRRIPVSMRILAELPLSGQNGDNRSKRVLVVGAGDAGALVVREMQKNPHLPLKPVCFLDDDPDKQRKQIHGIPVVGKLNDLPRTLITRRIDEVVIAIPSAPGRVIRQVAEVCRARNMQFRTMPGLFELLGGKVSVNRLREVEITDLLRR